jgi:hypothetical protein
MRVHGMNVCDDGDALLKYGLYWNAIITSINDSAVGSKSEFWGRGEDDLY